MAAARENRGPNSAGEIQGCASCRSGAAPGPGAGGDQDVRPKGVSLMPIFRKKEIGDIDLEAFAVCSP
jgi:hypothetical protein